MLDFENLELPKDETLTAKALELAEEAINLQAQIDDCEADLKQLKERMRQITETELPDIMRQDARDHLVLPDGRKVTLKEAVSATMPKDDETRRALFAWLAERDATDIIKSEIKVPFAKSQHNEALDLAHRLQGEGLPVSVSENIAPQTLSKFVRDRKKDGEDLPPESVLKVYDAKVAKIEAAK